MRKLLDSLENAQKAWVDLKKDAKGAHKLFKDYQPEEDLVKREKIIYTGSVKDFVRLTLPILDDQRFRVNGQTNREAFLACWEMDTFALDAWIGGVTPAPTIRKQSAKPSPLLTKANCLFIITQK